MKKQKQRITTKEYRARRKNKRKQDKYTELFDAMEACIKYRFFYGAIFIEYGLIEDRLASVSKSANRKYLNASGRHISIRDLWDNAKKIETDYSSILPEKYRDSLHKLDQAFTNWRKTRNDMEHRLADEPLDDGKVEKTALEGRDLTYKLRDSCGHLEYYLNTRGITRNET